MAKAGNQRGQHRFSKKLDALLGTKFVEKPLDCAST